ncbi:MAG: hypothetical protein E7181_00110 [Erysipelotrichaceae bacterium]|nr:hypothetical protein [Erysipelotrichaceae bacterium]
MEFKVTYQNNTFYFDEPVTVLDIVGHDKKIKAALVDNCVKELTYLVNKDCSITALTTVDREARGIYEASLRYLVAMAMKRIYPDLRIKFLYSISRTFYMHIFANEIDLDEIIKNLDAEMKKIIKADYPLERKKMSKNNAVRLLRESKDYDKIELYRYRPEKRCHLYFCDGYYNYMYYRMVPSTGYISDYKLLKYGKGIIIQYPRPDFNGQIPNFEDSPAYRQCLAHAYEQARLIGCNTVVGINKRILNDGELDVISLAEANHSRQLSDLGYRINKDKTRIKMICIAGPSSSGKTTFANRLRIELLSRGIHPLRLSLDDFFKDHNIDNGVDIESVEAIDIELFNKCVIELFEGKEVLLPVFNFSKREKEFTRKEKIKPNQPIIVEGIHALNEEVTKDIPRENKFKIFIEPDSQISLDNHNPLSLTDLRLLRRIVRDHHKRDTSAETTITMWESIRRGEFKWLYKTQEDADFKFNSALFYEIPLMKKYAMPLLKNIDRENKIFPIAERLIRMMKHFVDISDTWVPFNSILREFIGGSCYEDV